MEPINFCYWLQGFFELSEYKAERGLSAAQTQEINNHLKLVFTKVTPSQPFFGENYPVNPSDWYPNTNPSPVYVPPTNTTYCCSSSSLTNPKETIIPAPLLSC